MSAPIRAKIFEALIKLTRSIAIFEFSSTKRYASFNLDFECRQIEIIDAGDANIIPFAYQIIFPNWNLESTHRCEENGYESVDKWSTNCKSFVQG